MDPVVTIALYWVLFGATHLVLATGRVRAWLVDRLGAQGFVYAFSLVAVVTYGLLVHAYAGLRFDGAAGLALAAVPLARSVLYGVSFAGVTLAIAGVLVFPASPMAPPGMVPPGAVRPPRGLARITRHAFFGGTAMMAAAHTLLATRLTGVVFFGGTFLLVTCGAWLQDRKLLRRHGAPYAEYLAATPASRSRRFSRGGSASCGASCRCAVWQSARCWRRRSARCTRRSSPPAACG
jgi:uncharacterized membrane protein